MERRAFELFKALLDLSASDRAAALAAVEDDAVRARVAALLARDAAASGLDHAPVVGAGAALGARLAAEVAAPPVDVPPERVGSYRVLHLIGTGGMGVVYEAEQDHPRRRVALKTTHRWLRSGADRERFRGEVQALGGLLHPAIPQVYEVIEADGAPWLAMELVQGQRADRATAGWSVFRRAAMLRQLAEAAAHAHAHGLVHGDIKPANVLVTAAGAPKLLDFGLARRTGTTDLGGGTAGYRSPGQEIDQGLDPDVRTDVFALGRLGQRLIADAPVDLAAILDRATRPARADRYPDAAALAEDLGRFLRTEPVLARPAGPIYRLTRWLQRHRTAVVGFGLAGAAAASIAVGAMGVGAGLEHLREGRADAAYARLGERIVALEAEGSTDAAAAAFDTFVTLPEYAGTRAVARAWLARGQTRADDEDKLDHLANAWSTAPDPTSRRDALVAIARHAASIPNLPLLIEVVARIADPPADVGLAAAAARGDLVAAAGFDTAWAPLLRDLSGAQVHPDGGHVGGALRRGDDLWMSRRGHDAIEVLGRGGLRDGPAIPTPQPSLTFARLVGDERPLILNSDVVPRPQRVWDVVRGREALAVTDARLLGATSRGAVAWLGFGVSSEGGVLRRIDLDTGAVTSPDPEVESLGSEVRTFAWADLDDDGQDELVGVLGPWRAFGVRAWRVTPDGLTPMGDLRLGNATLLFAFRGPGGRDRLGVIKDDSFGSVEVFGAERPGGTPAGLHVLRWDGGFVDEAVVRWGSRTSRVPYAGSVADLDGDGLDELILNFADGTWLLHQRSDGSFDPLFLGGLFAVGGAQLDEDAADELVVGDRERLWGLGGGDTPVTGAPAPAVPAPPTADPAIAAADALAAVGLHRRAASRLRFLAGLRDGDAAAEVLIHAGETGLAASPPARDEAVADFAAAFALARSPGLRARAAEQAAESLYALGDWEGLARWLPEVDGSAAWVAPAKAALIRWEAAVPVAVPVASADWQVLAPESAPPGQPGLIRAFADQGPLWVRPVRVADGPVSIRAELDLRRLEVGGRLRIALRPPGGLAVLDVYVAALGGGGVARLHVGCGSAESVGEILDPERVATRLVLGVSAAEGRRWCEVPSGRIDATAPEIPPGDYELVLEAAGPDWPAEQLAEARIVSLTVRGLSLGAPGSSVDDAAVRAVFDQDPAALAAALPAALASPEREARVRRLLRTDHRALLPALMAVDPGVSAGLFGYAWSSQGRDLALASTRDALDEPALADLRSPDAGWLALQRHRARLARQRDRDDLAARILTDVLALDPGGAEGRSALRELAILAFTAGDEAIALARLQRWAAGSPTPTYDRMDLERDAPALARRFWGAAPRP